MDWEPVDSGPPIDQGSVFSPKILVLFAICVVIGIVFGVAFMSGQNASALLEMQTEDARSIKKAIEPKIAAFNDVNEKIQKMNPNSPDGELAKELAAAEFAVPGALLSTLRIPLPAGATDTVSQFAADTHHLKTLLEEHSRLTNKVDAEEIEALLEKNKELQENKAFAVMFDADDVRKSSERDDYQPKRGRLVGVKDYDEEKNAYLIQHLGSGREGEVPPEKIIPIDTAQILKTGGQNALQRYQWRVRNLKYYSNKITSYTEALQTQLTRAAEGDMESPAIAEPVAEPTPEPAAAPEEEPAEKSGAGEDEEKEAAE